MSIKQPFVGAVLAICGVALQVGIILVLRGIFIVLSVLGGSGISDPTALVSSLEEVFLGSAVNLVLSVLGLVLLCIALADSHYRAGWFFWFLLIYGVLLLVAFPVGTAFGIFFLVYLRAHRQEFGSNQPPSTALTTRETGSGF